MKIPKFLCRNEVTIKPYSGSGAYGPVYGNEYTAKCYVELKRKMIRNNEGDEIVANGPVIFRDEIDIPIKSELTWKGKTYVVQASIPYQTYGRFHHIEVFVV